MNSQSGYKSSSRVDCVTSVYYDYDTCTIILRHYSEQCVWRVCVCVAATTCFIVTSALSTLFCTTRKFKTLSIRSIYPMLRVRCNKQLAAASVVL